MSTKTLCRRAQRLYERCRPKPLIIRCSEAKDELLALLDAQIQRDKNMGIVEEDTWTGKDEETAKALDIILEEHIRQEEVIYNIKLVD